MELETHDKKILRVENKIHKIKGQLIYLIFIPFIVVL